MASGIVHEKAILITSPIVAAVSFHFTQDVAFAGSICIGYLLGIFFSPDLDLKIKTLSEKRMERAGIVGKLISAWATAYARIINTGRRPFVHRGISHWPIVGTLTRWLWFGFPLVFVGFLMACVGLRFDLPAEGTLFGFAIVFLGHCLSDLLHFILDYL
jgi:uncharacterized metal-binding protein